MRNLLPLFFAILINGPIFGQANPWADISESEIAFGVGTRDILPNAYRTLHLDFVQLKTVLAAAPQEQDFVLGKPGALLDFPLPAGGFESYEVWEAPVMAPELTAKYPNIRSYAGRNRQGDFIRFAISPMGLDALILPVDRSNTYLIKQYARGNAEDYLCFYQRDCPIPAGQQMECLMEEAGNEMEGQAAVSDRAGSCGNLRTYRLALACTGEYANFYGATGINKAPALAAMNATMTAVNALFEIEVGFRLVMIANNDNLIYTDPNIDPYTNATPNTMMGENQTTCNNVIGETNYDFGHVFGTGQGGVSLNLACSSNYKARCTSGNPNPNVDWWNNFVAHEMGHHFGAYHTQYNTCQGQARIEPGSGSTIMSYAVGYCPPKVQDRWDSYYHASSIGQMAAFINGAGNACAVMVPNGNSAPTCSALINKTIPKSTPFVLTVTGAADSNGDVLSYCWEQMDAYKNPVQPMPPATTNVNGPVFRSLLPSSSPSRYFPKFADVLNNTNDIWEVLPSVSRDLNFRVTIRDNHPDGGCTTEKDIVLTVKSTAGPFVVTQPNTAVNWLGNSSQIVTWNVAGTTANQINCANVAILLSTNGGATFSTLLASTPNDGTQAITIPNIGTTQARIMVQSVGNVFYDVSNVDFTITAVPQVIGGGGRNLGETLTVYPNPSSSFIQVIAPAKWLDQPLSLQIRDMVGRIVVQNPAYISGNDLEIGSLENGVYQVELMLNGEKLYGRFVRQ